MSKQEGKSILPFIIIGCGIAAVGVGAVLMVHNFLSSAVPAQKKLVQEIKVIRPPPPEELPPPPPPPPDEAEVPEPEQQPDPVASNDPPPGNLGIDAEGGAGSDGFGLEGRKGGRDLLGSGGSALAWYSTLLKGEILEQLQDIKAVRSGSFAISLQLWIRPDGTIERARLTRSTGDTKRDDAITSAFANKVRISQGPPADTPQPINIKLLSRA
jgi:protein TonB